MCHCTNTNGPDCIGKIRNQEPHFPLQIDWKDTYIGVSGRGQDAKKAGDTAADPIEHTLSLLQRPLMKPAGTVCSQTEQLVLVGGEDKAVPLKKQYSSVKTGKLVRPEHCKPLCMQRPSFMKKLWGDKKGRIAKKLNQMHCRFKTGHNHCPN